MLALRSASAAVVLALALPLLAVGCKSRGSTGTDGGPLGPADAQPSALAVVDAGPPSDETIPPTSSDELTARARHLLEALGKGDPVLASDILFPRDGWLALRDEADPGHDWGKHVDGPFQKAVASISKRHRELDRAQFVSIDLGHAVLQTTPRHHGWKKPLWTVRGTRLTYTVDGHTRTVAIREMTAWRGAWYVTRLR